MPGIVKRHFIFHHRSPSCQLGQKELVTWKNELRNYVPKILPLPLAQVKMVTNRFVKRNFMQPMERLSMHSWTHQFFFFLRGQGEMDFFSFSPCSQCVPIMFPKGYQTVPRDVPNSTWALSYMVCVKFNPHLDKLKR